MVLAPARRIAYLFPLNVQRIIVELGIRMTKFAVGKRKISIQYRPQEEVSFEVVLSASEFGGISIYFFYLLHGHWKHEVYEQEVVNHLLSRAGRCSVIDVGASYGMYSLLAASLPNVEKVIAIEASPVTCTYLGATLAKNCLQRRVTLLNSACSSKSDENFTLVEKVNSEWNQVAPSEFFDVNSIRSICVDRLVQDLIPLESVVFVKMDIEGHEPDAFAGMRELFGSGRDFAVMFEFHVGLLESTGKGTENFASALFQIPNSTLYLLDVKRSTLQDLDCLALCDLIETARRAEHPLNLFNLLLIRNSLRHLLPLPLP